MIEPRLLARTGGFSDRPYRLQGRVAGAVAGAARRRGARASRCAPDTEPSLFDAGADRPALSLATSATSAIRRDRGDVVAQARPQIVLHMAAQALVRRSLRGSGRNVRDQCAWAPPSARGPARSRRSEAVLVDHHRQGLSQRRRRPRLRRGRSARRPRSLFRVEGRGGDRVTRAMRASLLAPRRRRRSRRRAPATSSAAATGREDRLVPDVVARRAAPAMPLRSRNPEATRPWQHVLEPLAGYLALSGAPGRRRGRCRARSNFGPPAGRAATVAEVADAMLEALGAHTTLDRDGGAAAERAAHRWTLDPALASARSAGGRGLMRRRRAVDRRLVSRRRSRRDARAWPRADRALRGAGMNGALPPARPAARR